MTDRREKWTRIRIRFFGILFTLFFVITSARAYYLQIIKKEEWLKLADRQHQKIVPLTPARGTIYDCTGASLAVSIEMDSCYAEARSIQDHGQAAARLAPVLGMTTAAVEQKLAGSKNFVWLQRRLTPDKVAAIKALGVEGIGFVKESKRFYPNFEVAAHVIGFTGMDPEGLEGVELKYDSTLLGNVGYVVTERDALGRDVGQKGVVVKNSSKGYNLTLTLDKNLQYIAEKELAAAVLTSRARGGIAIVMESQTGRVLAMANYPSFNPNSVHGFSTQALRNHAITDSFEPGSTFKVFLVAAALEEKAVSPGEAFNCENGSFAIGGRTIHDTHSYGRLSVSDIIKHSSNIGAAKIGTRLGRDRLHQYLHDFGFGGRTGIDLPGEVSGSMRDKNQWFAVDLATISFGQGVSVSALQLSAAMSAIANGGRLMRPYLVEKVMDDNGVVNQKTEPQLIRSVISAKTAATLTKMLETVTVEGGTGEKAAVDGYLVAGKTGTAQKVDPVTKGYSADKRTASFLGFVPADRPRLTIMVVVDEPKTSPYGGIVAAPAFSAIARQSLCYLKVAPDRNLSARKAVCPSQGNAPVPAETCAEGPGYEETGVSAMPKLNGLSMRQVMKVMEKRGLNAKLIGSGRAVEQSPRAGERIRGTDQVWVRFVPTG